MSKQVHADRMNKVIQYIESNLEGDIDVKTLSSLACYSEFHFHRLFSAYVGESVYGYKKRLLLERSVKHLLYANESLSDVAAKCGYDNQASFNKAFKLQFNCSPSQVRKRIASVDTSRFNPNTSWSIEMEPEIVNLADIHLICARANGDYASAAEEAWGTLMKFTYSNRLMGGDMLRIGISHDDPSVTAASQIRYDAGVSLDADIKNEPLLQNQTLKGGKYAKFMHEGSYEQFRDTYSYIFNQWLPDSGFTLVDKPCFESYLNKDPRRTKPENLRTEIFVPIA